MIIFHSPYTRNRRLDGSSIEYTFLTVTDRFYLFVNIYIKILEQNNNNN